MKKRLNDWLKKNNKETLSAPFDKSGNYDVNGKYEWSYSYKENDPILIDPILNTGSTIMPCGDDSFTNPGVEVIVEGIMKHHNIK